jgi:hypothetical protein
MIVFIFDLHHWAGNQSVYGACWHGDNEPLAHVSREAGLKELKKIPEKGSQSCRLDPSCNVKPDAGSYPKPIRTLRQAEQPQLATQRVQRQLQQWMHESPP